MKRFQLRSLGLGSACALLCAIEIAPAHAGSTVNTYAHLSPVRAPDPDGGYFYMSPNFAAYEANVLSGLAAGGVATGSGPAAFDPLAQTSFSTYEVTGTSFHSWRGDVNPTGAYAGEFGTYLRVAATVSSSTSFNLGDVYVSAHASDFDIPKQSLDSGAPYVFGVDLIGLSYGPDGVRGGGDDILYADPSANAGTRLNELYFLGVAYVNIFFSPEEELALGGTPQAVYAASNDFFSPYSPYVYDVSYSLEQNGSVLADATFSGTIAPVPEPSTRLALTAGLVFLASAARKRLKGLKRLKRLKRLD